MNRSVPERFAEIEARIEAACSRCGRDPSEITLLGAAKRQSEERIVAACRAGLGHLGENLVQEGEAHRRLLADFEATWHLIGPLQSNKARRAVEIFDFVHSIDRLKIARKIDSAAARTGKQIKGFLEVNLGDEPTKHGFSASELPEAIEAVGELAHLQLVGLMAIPPVERSRERARAWFRRLRELRDRHFRAGGCLSMGMSADFEIAIEEGATHVRVGSALFGERAARGGEAA